MRLGKLPYSILKRSVWKQTGRAKAPILQGAGAGIDSAALFVSGDVLLTETTAVLQDEWVLPAMMARLTGDLAAEGGHPVGVEAALTLPESCEEPELRRWMEQLTKLAEEQEIQVIGGHTTTLAEVAAPIATLTMVGGRAAWTPGRIKPGDQLIVSGWIGMEGMLRILDEKEQELKKRFAPAFINQIRSYRQELFAVRAISVAKAEGSSVIRQITEGGIMAALWNLAKETETGLELDLKKLSILQETIEVCEHYRINPYQLTSTGCLLIVTDDGEVLADELKRNNIQASVIGKTTDDNDKKLHNGDEVRYIDRPAPDEIFKIYGGIEHGQIKGTDTEIHGEE